MSLKQKELPRHFKSIKYLRKKNSETHNILGFEKTPARNKKKNKCRNRRKLDGENIATFIQMVRINWLEHVWRARSHSTMRAIMK